MTRDEKIIEYRNQLLRYELLHRQKPNNTLAQLITDTQCKLRKLKAFV